LYGLSVELPEYLIINGLIVNFISFEDIANMLQRNKIERYIIDSFLQTCKQIPPGTQYRIIIISGKNGTTYLVKARYNQQTEILKNCWVSQLSFKVSIIFQVFLNVKKDTKNS
jgi:hypothetical protein